MYFCTVWNLDSLKSSSKFNQGVFGHDPALHILVLQPECIIFVSGMSREASGGCHVLSYSQQLTGEKTHGRTTSECRHLLLDQAYGKGINLT